MNQVNNLLGGRHLLQALGIDNQYFLAQLDQYQNQMEVLHELRDSFQQACVGMSALSLASMLQNGGIAPPLTMSAPNMGKCGCPQAYAQPQTFDFGATPGAPPWSPQALAGRMRGAMFERFLKANPFARQQFEMAMGGKIVNDGIDDGRLTIQPFAAQAFTSGGGNPYAAAMGMFDQMNRATMQLGASSAMNSMYQGMMLSALTNMLSSGSAAGNVSGVGRGQGGGSPYVDWFGAPGNPQLQGQGGAGQGNAQVGQFNGPFQPGVAGPTQGEFGLAPNDGSDISGVLNDPSLTVEDKVCLMIMMIMKQMDKEIEKQAQDINKLQQQQNKQGGGGGGGGGKGGKGKGGGGGGGGGSDKSIDVETMKLKRLIDKRGQMFDMLRQIIDKYNQTAKGIIDSIGR